jgi:hypothetical protein
LIVMSRGGSSYFALSLSHLYSHYYFIVD